MMRGYLPTLDGWRSVAIIMVMAYHLLATTFDKNTTPYWLVHQGAKGVDIFFGLSGLLITLRLLDERDANGSINLWRFYARRGFRILPPYLTYLVVITALAWFGIITATRRELLSCLFFYRNYIPPPDLKNWYTAHFWTLSVEEHFYLVCPLIIACCSVRRSIRIAAAAAFGVAIWRKVHAYFAISESYGLGRTDLCIDGLIWGAFAALMLHSTEVRVRISRYFTPIWCWFILLFLVTLVWFEPPFGLTIRAFLIPWMLFCTLNNPGSIFYQILECKLMRWIGQLSYSLYIWQQLCISEIWDGFSGSNGPFSARLTMIFAIASTLILATISHYCIERPCLMLGKKVLQRPGRVSQGGVEGATTLANINQAGSN